MHKTPDAMQYSPHRVVDAYARYRYLPGVVPKTPQEELAKYAHLDAYVHFTDINKVGIKPTYRYGNVLGVYCYPLDAYLGGWAATFATERPYIQLLEYSRVGKKLPDIGNMEKHEAWRVTKIAKKRAASMGKTPEEIRSIEEECKENVSIKNNPGALLNWFLVQLFSNPKIQNYVWREAGYGLIVDEGHGILHSSEPTQAVFLSSKSFKHVTMIPNKTKSSIPPELGATLDRDTRAIHQIMQSKYYEPRDIALELKGYMEKHPGAIKILAKTMAADPLLFIQSFVKEETCKYVERVVKELVRDKALLEATVDNLAGKENWVDTVIRDPSVRRVVLDPLMKALEANPYIIEERMLKDLKLLWLLPEKQRVEIAEEHRDDFFFHGFGKMSDLDPIPHQMHRRFIMGDVGQRDYSHVVLWQFFYENATLDFKDIQNLMRFTNTDRIAYLVRTERMGSLPQVLFLYYEGYMNEKAKKLLLERIYDFVREDPMQVLEHHGYLEKIGLLPVVEKAIANADIEDIMEMLIAGSYGSSFMELLFKVRGDEIVSDRRFLKYDKKNFNMIPDEYREKALQIYGVPLLEDYNTALTMLFAAPFSHWRNLLQKPSKDMAEALKRYPYYISAVPEIYMSDFLKVYGDEFMFGCKEHDFTALRYLETYLDVREFLDKHNDDIFDILEKNDMNSVSDNLMPVHVMEYAIKENPDRVDQMIAANKHWPIMVGRKLWRVLLDMRPKEFKEAALESKFFLSNASDNMVCSIIDTPDDAMKVLEMYRLYIRSGIPANVLKYLIERDKERLMNWLNEHPTALEYVPNYIKEIIFPDGEPNVDTTRDKDPEQPNKTASEAMVVIKYLRSTT